MKLFEYNNYFNLAIVEFCNTSVRAHKYAIKKGNTKECYIYI